MGFAKGSCFMTCHCTFSFQSVGRMHKPYFPLHYNVTLLVLHAKLPMQWKLMKFENDEWKKKYISMKNRLCEELLLWMF